MHRTIRLAAAAFALSATGSCANFDMGDALFKTACVASEADCLKQCGTAYRAYGGAASYSSCANMCQPAGGDGCD
jgi:hypothetical protein